MPSAWFRRLVHNAAPPSLHGVREGPFPRFTLLWGAPTPCRPSRRTSFPSLGDPIVSPLVHAHWLGRKPWIIRELVTGTTGTFLILDAGCRIDKPGNRCRLAFFRSRPLAGVTLRVRPGRPGRPATPRARAGRTGRGGAKERLDGGMNGPSRAALDPARPTKGPGSMPSWRGGLPPAATSVMRARRLRTGRDPRRRGGHRLDDTSQQREARQQVRLIDPDESALGKSRGGSGLVEIVPVDHAPVVFQAIAGRFHLVQAGALRRVRASQG